MPQSTWKLQPKPQLETQNRFFLQQLGRIWELALEESCSCVYRFKQKSFQRHPKVCRYHVYVQKKCGKTISKHLSLQAHHHLQEASAHSKPASRLNPTCHLQGQPPKEATHRFNQASELCPAGCVPVLRNQVFFMHFCLVFNVVSSLYHFHSFWRMKFCS